MKKKKLVKGIQINLITFLFFIVIVIIGKKFLNDKVFATPTSTCKACGMGVVLAEEKTTYTTHTWYCSNPACTLQANSNGYYIENHSGVNHPSGKCDVCDYIYQNHEPSGEEICKYVGEKKHKVFYKCSLEECPALCDLGEETADCYGGEAHNSGGLCKGCNYEYIEHEEEEDTVYLNENSHKKVISCSVCGIVETNTGAHTNSSAHGCSCEPNPHYKSTKLVPGGCVSQGNGKHINYYKCNVSGCEVTYKGESGASCEYVAGKCQWCTASEPEPEECSHTGGIHPDGICTKCGEKYQEHGKGDYFWDWTNKIYHTIYYKCTLSGCNGKDYYKQENHTANHASGGQCTICKMEKVQIHSQSTIIEDYTDINDATHTPKYKCTYQDCDQTAPYTGIPVAHTYIDGKCAGGQSEPTGGEECSHIYTTQKDDTQHWVECSKCNEEKTGSRVNHTYTTYTDKGNGTDSSTCTGCTHEKTENHTYSNGTCTANGCGAKEPTGGEECSHSSYIQKNNYLKHWEECSECGEIKEGTEENHYGGTHPEGKCSVCGYKYENHGKNYLLGVTYQKIDSKTHKVTYKCTSWTCSETYEETEQHNGAKHSNGGRCEGCKEQYDPHIISTQRSSWDIKESTHAPVYKCTHANCSETEIGVAEEHKGATHQNGECIVCGKLYEEHKRSDVVARYEKTLDEHTPLYACAITGCEETYRGTTEEHKGGNHQDGKCSICKELYQTHTIIKIPIDYNKNDETHTPIYKCSYDECTVTEYGTPEKHIVSTWVDNENGTHSGECTICEQELTKGHDYDQNGECTKCNATKECEHVYEMKSNHIQHWEECTKCNQVKEATLEIHKKEKIDENGDTISATFQDNGNGKHIWNCVICTYPIIENHNYEDGKCIDCNVSEPEEHCNHVNNISKYDDTYHWEECSECGEIKEGSKKEHTITTWENNGNGTHSGTCTICENTVTKEHNYDENGECTKCDVIKDCEHTYEMKSNDIQHWEECSKCNQVKEGTLEGHQKNTVDENGVDVSTVFQDTKDGKHTWNCVICSHKIIELHQYNEEGKCIDCNSKNSDAECKHIYGEEHDAEQHWQKCLNCGEIKEDTKENHTFEYIDKNNGTHDAQCTVCRYTIKQECIYINGVCTKCEGQEECEHIYEKKNDDTKHWEQCTKCSEIKEGTTEKHIYEYTDNGNETHKAKCIKCRYEVMKVHNYENGECTQCKAKQEAEEKECKHEKYELKKNNNQHWEECKECGNIKDGTLENHIYNNYEDNKDGTHSARCSKCQYVTKAEHKYNKDGKCTNCKAEDPNAECEHDYQMENNKTTHWKECRKCNQVKKGSVEEHKIINYQDNGDGTHIGICSICEYKLKNNHNYKDEKCVDCKVKQEKTEDECEHIYVIQSDKDNHWAECKKCNKVKEGSLKTHIYEKYVDNGDGTHTGVCSDCGYKKTENHKEVNCKECEKIQSTNKKEEIKDTTTTEKEIPKAGIKSTIAIIIIALATISGVTIVKMKKYKDI